MIATRGRSIGGSRSLEVDHALKWGYWDAWGDWALLIAFLQDFVLGTNTGVAFIHSSHGCRFLIGSVFYFGRGHTSGRLEMTDEETETELVVPLCT